MPRDATDAKRRSLHQTAPPLALTIDAGHFWKGNKMKISALIPLALMALVVASAAVQADESSAPPKKPTETNQPMMGNGSQGMMGMMNMMGQMQQMMESCNHMMKSSNEQHDKQNAPEQKDGRG
jgi:hypothetical protein